MSGLLAHWLLVAIAFCAYRDVIGDDVTWPGCRRAGLLNQPYHTDRVVQPGVVDLNATGLFLGHCNFTSLEPDRMKVYPKIRTLYLIENNLQFLETGIFDSLVSLNYLTLRQNGFLGKDLPPNLFRHCAGLFELSFTSNNMSETPSDLLQGLNDLLCLYCSNCFLQQIPSFITSPVIFNLRNLYLNGNQLSRLDDKATFANITNLNLLELKNNKIDYLHEDLLKPLKNISKIYLNGNKIRYIPEHLFQNKSSLRIIDLSNNFISYLPETAFIGTGLTSLQLNNNRLAYLSDNFFTELQRSGVTLRTFYFDGNPWPCACLNELLVKVKKLNIVYEHSMYDGKHKNCIMIDYKCEPDIYQNYFMKLISTQ